MKRLALFLAISVVSVSAQTATRGGQSASSTPPSPVVLVGGHGFPGRARGPEGPSPVTNLLKLLFENVNSTEAMADMRKIWENDRWFDFQHFQVTAKNVAEIMREAGLDDVQIGYAHADGVTQSGFWTEPMAWDAHVGTLEIVSPNVPEDMRVVADYQRVPASLCMWSGPTPRGGVETEIVLPPKDMRNADLKGKLVLGGHMSKTALAKAGALGMLHESATNPALLDERDWVNSFGDNGWSFTKGSTPLVCFSITPRSQQYLHQLLEHGPVKVRANVDTRYYDGQYPYVSGAILGTDGPGAEEVFSLGHLFEEGASDNATGVASIIEATATLNRLIKEGKLPRPKRTIRILGMGERYGTLAYLYAHQDRVKKTIAGMCIDSPAGFQNLAGTEFNWVLNPQSATSFVDAFTVRLASEYFPMVDRPFHWSEYNSGTDNDLGDPMINIPTVAPRGGHGIQAHHTSFDTPSQVDPNSLRDLSVMNAAYAYFLASAGPDQMHWMAQLALSRGYDQINAAAENSLDQIAAAKDADTLGRLLYWETARVDYNLMRETKAVKQAADLPEGLAGLQSFAGTQKTRIEDAVQQRAAELHLGTIQPSVPPVNPQAEKIIVRRKKMGTITMEDIPPSEREGYPVSAFWGPTTSALYWCDGKRNLAEVIKMAELELGQSNFDWVGYFKFLQKHGYVDFVQG
ncbi:M28 family peptidase [Edaphobacter sp. HDX4]|uniref:M28 family peptidase n=1 Tax=Edaphobacter sp. HDX4 TaxID=2794064 RepID=UPI002FE6AA8D